MLHHKRDQPGVVVMAVQERRLSRAIDNPLQNSLLKSKIPLHFVAIVLPIRICVDPCTVKQPGNIRNKEREAQAITCKLLYAEWDMPVVESDYPLIHRLERLALKPLKAVFGNNDTRRQACLVEIFGKRPHNISKPSGFCRRIALCADV